MRKKPSELEVVEREILRLELELGALRQRRLELQKPLTESERFNQQARALQALTAILAPSWLKK